MPARAMAAGADLRPWAGSADGERGAVVLCPDLGVDPAAFAVPGASALPEGLAADGWQVYVVDPWSSEAAEQGGFDAVAGEVYPAILQAVRARSTGPRTVWIGHGICGLLPLAAGQGGDEAPEWVALGTRLDYQMPPEAAVAWAQAWAEGRPPDDDVQRRLWWTGVQETRPGRVGSAPRGAPALGSDGLALTTLASNVIVSPPPAEVCRDLLRWYDTGRVTDRAGARDHLAALGQVRGPALLVAGSSDPLAPPEDVLAGLDRCPEGADVRYRMLSLVNGHREEYGHLGMLLSRHAPRDLDRLVRGWLQGRRALP